MPYSDSSKDELKSVNYFSIDIDRFSSYINTKFISKLSELQINYVDFFTTIFTFFHFLVLLLFLRSCFFSYVFCFLSASLTFLFIASFLVFSFLYLYFPFPFAPYLFTSSFLRLFVSPFVCCFFFHVLFHFSTTSFLAVLFLNYRLVYQCLQTL